MALENVDVEKFPNRFDPIFFYLPRDLDERKKKSRSRYETTRRKKGLKRLRKHGQQQSRTSVPLADRQFDSFWSIASLDLSCFSIFYFLENLERDGTRESVRERTCIDFHLTLQNSSGHSIPFRAKFTVEVKCAFVPVPGYVYFNIIVSHSWSETI